MPSISSLEKRLPLRIENLTFSRLNTKVNKASYQLGVYRDYGRNEIPSDVLKMNNRGGSSDDIDQYGVIIYPGKNNVLPGDIDLRRQIQQNDPVITQESSEQNLVQLLEMLEILLAKRLNQEYIEDDETRNATGDRLDRPKAFLERKYRDITSNNSVEFIQFQIQSVRDRLSAFNNRRNNTNRPYTAWIQLTTHSPGRKIQRVAYNKCLYEASKTVHTKLFGNRGSSISVKNLKIENQILRFPAGTLLKIENLEVLCWNTLAFERFIKVIDPSSLPIQQLKVASDNSTNYFEHNIVREAKTLIIYNNPFENHSWTPILLNLTNRIVCLENENALNPANNYLDLIENWLEKGRPVGTTFSMRIENEATVKQCLDTLRLRLEVLGSSEKQVQLRINASLMLNVSHEMIKQQGKFLRENESKCWLRLKVVRGRSD